MVLFEHYLGSHIAWCARSVSTIVLSKIFGNTQISHMNIAYVILFHTFSIQHQILWLKITMHNFSRM